MARNILLNTAAPLTELFPVCIFDFDGVIVDSEPVHAEAKRITLNNFKIEHPESVFSDFKGRPDSAFFSYVSDKLTSGKLSAHKLHLYKNDIYLKLFNSVKLIDGIIPFLELSKFKFEKIGLATSATRHDLSLTFNKYSLHKYFDFIVTGEDTNRHKPDPEPFQRAIILSGYKAGNIMILEDSPNGILAGKAAGCYVAGISTSFPRELLISAGADLIVDDYISLAEKL